jgi:hypothetical protein
MKIEKNNYRTFRQETMNKIANVKKMCRVFVNNYIKKIDLV